MDPEQMMIAKLIAGFAIAQGGTIIVGKLFRGHAIGLFELPMLIFALGVSLAFASF